MADPGSYLPSSTPTPEQIAQAQAFADLLSQNAQARNSIISPWQGASNLVNAVVGGYQSYKDAQDYQKGRQQGGATVAHQLYPQYQQLQSGSGFGSGALPSPWSAPAAGPLGILAPPSGAVPYMPSTNSAIGGW